LAENQRLVEETQENGWAAESRKERWEWAGQSIFLEEENRKKGKVGSSCM